MRTAKSTWRRVTLVMGSLLGLCASGVLGQTLKEVTKFELPGPGGKRFDYLTIDPEDHYLISAHLAADQTYVIDLRTNKVVATVTDTPGAEGVEYVPELKKFYTSNAHDNAIGFLDLQRMKVVKKLKTEPKPDGSAYAAPFHKLYVSDERGKATLRWLPLLGRPSQANRGYQLEEEPIQFWQDHAKEICDQYMPHVVAEGYVPKKIATNLLCYQANKDAMFTQGPD